MLNVSVVGTVLLLPLLYSIFLGFKFRLVEKLVQIPEPWTVLCLSCFGRGDTRTHRMAPEIVHMAVILRQKSWVEASRTGMECQH